MSTLTANILLLVGGLGVLYFGAEWLVRGSARLAASLGLHPIVVGLTVVSLGTSAPEMVVCLVAALRGNPDIAMGNVMGSNLANIGLILGVSALVRPLEVASRVVHREVPIMILITILLYPLIMDDTLGRVDGMILMIVIALYTIFVFRSGMKEQPAVLDEFEEFARMSGHTPTRIRGSDGGLVLAGGAGLLLGGYAINQAAVFVATAMGISEMIIGLTVVAIGTSLPELATSVVAALRKEADIAVGNVIGSNIFNIAAVLGLTGIVSPLSISPSILTEELPAVLLISIVSWPVCRSGWAIRRWEGGILLAVYGGLAYWLIFT